MGNQFSTNIQKQDSEIYFLTNNMRTRYPKFFKKIKFKYKHA